jgi:hypothetical protein
MIAALYVNTGGCYFGLPDVDPWDAVRDARNYHGRYPVVAHPPCRLWGAMSHLSTAPESEKDLAIHAVACVRICGGALEHPAFSKLWKACNMPRPGEGRDRFGGWTMPIDQNWVGHRARKPTWIYIVGVEPNDLPVIPLSIGPSTHLITNSGRRSGGGRLKKGEPGWRPEVTRPERAATPIPFRDWLIAVARLSKTNRVTA